MKRNVITAVVLIIFALVLIPTAQARPRPQDSQEKLIKEVLKATFRDLGYDPIIEYEYDDEIGAHVYRADVEGGDSSAGTYWFVTGVIMAFPSEASMSEVKRQTQKVAGEWGDIETGSFHDFYSLYVTSETESSFGSLTWIAGRFVLGVSQWETSHFARHYAEVLYDNAVEYGLIEEGTAGPSPTPGAAPVVQITAPEDQAVFYVEPGTEGKSVTVQVEVSDPDDDLSELYITHRWNNTQDSAGIILRGMVSKFFGK